ncbi:unnamed protein product [Brachionus calyciflorus]|uniref:Integrase catalytic domain-containing protein n=1 Tax=Brachionus calyciflorus TaxID=104777 RepID=A0A814CGW3_9BILA|nr:unnamed protein product [Brachionus calyciflorus]
MFVYAQVADNGKLLKVECDPNDLVSSLKEKINYELGVVQPDDNQSLNYLGAPLDSSLPLCAYNIRESSLLYLGQTSYSPVSSQSPTQSQQYPPMAYTAKVPLQYTPYHQYSHQYQHQQIQPNQYPARCHCKHINLKDYFTKYCIVSDFTALITAKFMFNEVICIFGMFWSIISDYGSNYRAKLFTELCKLCDIKKLYSTKDHSEINGQVERTIKPIKQIITMYFNTDNTISSTAVIICI